MKKFVNWFNKEFDEAFHPFEPIGILFFAVVGIILLIINCQCGYC